MKKAYTAKTRYKFNDNNNGGCYKSMSVIMADTLQEAHEKLKKQIAWHEDAFKSTLQSYSLVAPGGKR